MKILVVDDEIEICDFLKRFFEEREFNVVCANNGEEAIAMASSYNPKIILMDIRMPVMDGLEAIRNLQGKIDDVSVIMVTADENPESIQKSANFGAVKYITKPLVLRELEKTVMECAKNF